MEPDELRLLPRRSRRYGVGKEIGGAVYIHQMYEELLGSIVPEAKKSLPAEFEYTIVKYQANRGTITFLRSPDFDSMPEPAISAYWIVYPGGRSAFSPEKDDPMIYHHKWLFVSDSYPGFNVEESKARSLCWVTLEPPVDRSRIGRRGYWVAHVIPRLSQTVR